jgi:hypothetical protein
MRNYVRPDGTPSKLLEPILIGMTGQDEDVRQGGIYFFINRNGWFRIRIDLMRIRIRVQREHYL